MDDVDPTSRGGEVPHIPDHLRPALGAAAELELELASDGHWPPGDEAERPDKRDRVLQAARTVDNWEASGCTREEVGKLACVAVGEQEPGRWPRTLEEADDIVSRAALTRDLILFRDVMGARPTQQDIDEPL
jgi:hypothetical protein